MAIYFMAFMLQILFLFLFYNKCSIKQYYMVAVIPCFLLLFFMYAFRTGTGIDDDTYKRIFNEIAMYHTNSESLQRIDLSFKLISNIFAKLGFSYQIIFIFYSACSFILIYKSVKLLCEDKEQVILAILSFYAFCMTVSITVMRQFLSAAFLLYAAALIIKKRNLRSMLMVLLAVFFHNGAILCLPIHILFFQRNRKITDFLKWILPMLAIMFLSCTFFLKYIVTFLRTLFPVYAVYIGYQNWGMMQGIVTTKILLLFIFYLQLFFKKVNNATEDLTSNLLETGEMVYLCIYFATLAMGWIHRAEVYYFLFSIFIMGSLYQKFKTEQNRKVVFFTCLIFVILYGFYSIYMEQFSANSIIPYRWNFIITR